MRTAHIIASIAFLLAACGKVEEQIPLAPSASDTMPQQVAAIRSCMEQGLSEETCAGVHRQMMSGTLNGSSSMAACEEQYGAGQCGNVPVAKSDGSSGSIIMPLIAGAALGYLASSMLSTNAMPSSALVPQRSWLENRPAAYQQAVQRERAARSFVFSPSASPKPNSFVQKDGYGDKKMTVNGVPPPAGTSKVPVQKGVPGAVTPQPAKPSAPAAVQPKVTVEHKPPASPYAQTQRPAAPAPTPKVQYTFKPSPPSTPPSRSMPSGRR